MNIVVINTDQQRRDTLGVYGQPIPSTPNIDSIAEGGMVFDRAFTTTPICGPARASMLTGLYPVHHGILRNPESGSVGGRDFAGPPVVFSQILADRGYACHHIGKWHVGTELTATECGSSGIHYPGYGYPDGHPHYLSYLSEIGIGRFELHDRVYAEHTDGTPGPLLKAVQEGGVQASVPHYLVNQTLEAIRKSASTEGDFFVRCDFWGPHIPFIVPEEYMAMYDPNDIPVSPSFQDPLRDKPPVQRHMRNYWGVQDLNWETWAELIAASYGYVSLIDYEVGRILDLLTELGIDGETAVFFTTDHGGMLGAHGLCDKGPYLYDELCRIPLIASVPGMDSGRSDAIVYNMDIGPTCLHLCGIDIPENLDACSFVPILSGQRETVRGDFAFLEFYGHQVPVLQKVIRTEEFKYIFNGQDDDEYYDLIQDPMEIDNVAGESSYARDVAAARRLLRDVLVNMEDPVLRYFEGTRMHG